MQSNLSPKLHVAIIMDGNGRWATRRGLPRHAGHEAGTEAVRRVAAAAPEHGIGTLTLYAFSADNWRRPQTEVAALMGLFRAYLRAQLARLAETGTRLSIIGRRDRLPDGFAAEIARAEANTSRGETLHVRIAIDYSARDAILRAAALAGGAEQVDRATFARFLTGEPACSDVDLLIRTGGEQRLSDFLLWESAYAELYFTDRMWPEFGADDLAAAVATFRQRERRFGGLIEPTAA
jgi:undecaprenyl diphosphate synthase